MRCDNNINNNRCTRAADKIATIKKDITIYDVKQQSRLWLMNANTNQNNIIIPKLCNYGCNTRIYWNISECTGLLNNICY